MGILDFFRGKIKRIAPTTKLTNSDMMGIARNVGGDSHNGYWKGFKIRKPDLAASIEKMCGRNMEALSDGESFQVVTTFTRWSSNANLPIGKLKENFNQQMQSLLEDGATYSMLLKRFKEEKSKEARKFNISEDYTISNYMYEWLLEMKSKSDADALNRHIAKQLNVTDYDSFEESIKQTEEELNLAPDISKLDREENKLFALAKEGAEMFRKFDPMDLDGSPAPVLTDGGYVEALILCSTMVIELHSSFKNELDMDEQTDRYFLLLADTIIGDAPNDIIGFINSRISFYKNECSNWANMSALEALMPNNAISHIYNTLYVNPLSEHPEIVPQGLSTHHLIMFRTYFEKVRKSMIKGRERIKGKVSDSEYKLREQALKTFDVVITPTMRAKFDYNIAYIITSQVIEMVKLGEINESIGAAMSADMIMQIQNLIVLCRQTSLSGDEIIDILEDAQNEFIKTFNR